MLEAVFPKKCMGCGTKGRYFCAECVEKQGKVYFNCPECGQFSFQGQIHTSCLKKLSLNGHFATYSYTGCVREGIKALKYRFVSDLADEMVELISPKFRKLNFKHAVLIPIPLHKKRRNWRGFNQSELLGEKIAETMGWKFNKDILIRTKHTRPQMSLKGDERRENMKGVFSLSSKYQLMDTNYLIFDDVWTTGSTVKEAGKLLKKAGAKTVWGLTVCG